VFKADRADALYARSLARLMVNVGLADEVTVTVAFRPGAGEAEILRATPKSGRWGPASASQVAQPRQGLDGLAGRSLCNAKFVELLQVQPELGARAEKMPEAQRRIAGHGTLPIQDLRYAVRGHPDLARQFGGTHAEFLELLGEVLARMNRRACHDDLSDSPRSRR
jgi:hypothetical protein